MDIIDPKRLQVMIDVPPLDMLGPAMAALEPRQRKFVCALAVFGGDQAEAYKCAGYSVTNDNSAAACASRLARSDKIIAAIKEEAHRRLNGGGILAVSTLLEIASMRSNSTNKERLKAAELILDRTGLHGKTEQSIVIRDERTTKDLIEFIRANAQKVAGVDPQELLQNARMKLLSDASVVDAEFEVVDELADIL